jgi:plastocyanin
VTERMPYETTEGGVVMRRFLVPMLLCAGVLAFTGCGSSSSGDSSSSTPAAPATTSEGGASTEGGASAGGGVAITMKNISFAPETIHVKVGQKITWTNDDSAPHNVTSQSGEKIASDTFGQGGTFSFTPTKAGTIKYVCTVHPGMDGTIVVTQ